MDVIDMIVVAIVAIAIIRIKMRPKTEEDLFDGVSWKTFRLDPRVHTNKWFKPSKRYVQELQICYEQLLESSADNYLFDIETLKERYQDLVQQHFEAKAELAMYKGTETVLRGQVEDALKYQNASGRKAEVYDSAGIEMPEQREQKKIGNKYASNNGNSKKENMRMAAAMAAYNIPVEEIAEAIGIGVDATKGYLSTIKKFVRTDTDYLTGHLMIHFSGDYKIKGQPNVWDLDDMFGDEGGHDFSDSENHSSEGTSSDMGGVIVKSLEIPIFTG